MREKKQYIKNKNVASLGPPVTASASAAIILYFYMFHKFAIKFKIEGKKANNTVKYNKKKTNKQNSKKTAMCRKKE